ncbi:MAG: efflux RND transporter periplasmic adaptor subunit [Spirosomataceae bacterium]|jgi:membrane fusion protein, heavy metal efflux system
MKKIMQSPTSQRDFLKKLLWLSLQGLSGLFFLTPAFAQHDHDHGGESAKVEKVKMQKSEIVSERYEVVLKYEHLHAEEPAAMKLYLSEVATNRAIGGAKLTINSSLAPDANFIVKPAEKGIYNITGTFPKDSTYSMTVKIDGELGSDLVALKGVTVGHEEAEEHDHEEEAGSPFTVSNWQFWGLLGGGLLLGILLTYFVMRSRNRKALVVLIIVFSQLPTANWQTVNAQHEGHNHGDEGGKSKANLSDEFEVPKETQFLFEVLTQPLNEGAFDETVQLYGTIVPSSTGQAVVQTPQTGRLVGLNARVGQRVSKGQTLATLEQTLDATAQVSLQAERNTIEAELTAARKEYERLKKIEDIAAKRDISEAEARLQKAEENLKVFNSIAKSSKGNTRMVALTAPIAGVVAPFSVAIGSTVGLGETIFTITNLSTVYVEAQAFGNDTERLKNNSDLEVVSTAEGIQKRSERIHLLSSAQAVNANQSQKILFELNNSDRAFKVGEFVTVRLKTEKSSRSLSLPNAAISQINGKPVVFVKESPETFRVVYVATGTNNGDRTIIDKGLQTGEKVVISSAYQLKMMFMNQ